MYDGSSLFVEPTMRESDIESRFRTLLAALETSGHGCGETLAGEDATRRTEVEAIRVDTALLGWVEGLERHACGKRLEILGDIDEPLLAYASRPLLEAMFYVVAQSAIRHTDPNGFVHIAARKVREWVRIDISDTGRPISERAHFIQSDKGFVPRFLRALAESMGAHVNSSCEPVPGITTTFWLRAAEDAAPDDETDGVEQHV